MKAVIQRVTEASVSVEGTELGRIGQGFMVLLGVADSDTDEDIQYMVRKITNMRIFEDENDRMNLSLKDVQGELLIISQFTLFANTKKAIAQAFLMPANLPFPKRCIKSLSKPAVPRVLKPMKDSSVLTCRFPLSTMVL